jgi:hypothetical protein
LSTRTTRIPSFDSSAWILLARPQFSMAIRMMRAFVASEIGGRPGPGVEIDRQYLRNPSRCQWTTVAGRTTTRIEKLARIDPDDPRLHTRIGVAGRRRLSASKSGRRARKGVEGRRDRNADHGRLRRIAAILPTIGAGVHGSRSTASRTQHSGCNPPIVENSGSKVESCDRAMRTFPFCGWSFSKRRFGAWGGDKVGKRYSQVVQ